MRSGGFVGPAAWLAMLLCIALAWPAVSGAPPKVDPRTINSKCFASGDRTETLAAVAHQPDRWNCRRGGGRFAAERAFIRFDIDPAKPRQHFLVTSRGALSAIHLLAIDGDGTTRQADYPADRLQPSQVGGFFRVPLPQVSADTRQIIVAFDLPTTQKILERAHLAPGPASNNPHTQRTLALIAALCGMLAMPLLFNAAFYRVLRERFLLWHAALTASLMATIVVNSGLSTYLVDLPVMALNALTVVGLGVSVALGGMFASSFIEKEQLDPRLRRMLPIAAAWSIAISLFHATFPFVARAVQMPLYHVAYIPVLVLYIAVATDAVRKGSRAAKFQVAGWGPLLVVGIVRLLGELTPYFRPDDAMMLVYLGCVFEVLATTMGVADRFMAIKNQRDLAQTEAQMLERLSERDALTGLLNRRVIEERFHLLRAEGFTTLAIIDLDHFKRINDSYGHAIGDEVLKLAAKALAPDDHALAFRLGGEEFMLLLRGRDAMQRAESRRRAITTRVAGEIPGLEQPLTASMGVIEASPEALPEADFAELYRRADVLLYEAKQAGRNRMLSERLKAFVTRKQGNRRAA